MARITENPKFIGGGILLALLVAAYLHGPEFVRQITAPPPKPAVPPAPVLEELKFYRLVPKVLPERWQDLLQAKAGKETMFDEVPRDAKVAKREVLPDLPVGWHLSSIYFSPDERLAVVSGTILREGDFLEPFTVKIIQEDKVIFRHSLGEREMTVGQKVKVPGSAAPPADGTKRFGPAEGEDNSVIPKALEGLDKWRATTEESDKMRGAPK